MEQNISLSPKMQELCLKILNILEEQDIKNINDLYVLLNERIPIPLLSFATDTIFNLNLAEYSVDTLTISEPNKEKQLHALQNGSHHFAHAIFDMFERRTLKWPYQLPKNKNITIRELKPAEYFNAMEFYNYEMLSLFMSNHMENHYFNTHYLLRLFAYYLINENSNKISHVYIAEADGHILSFISVSNYAGDTVLLEHHLPCENHEIFNVNFVLTRPEFRRQGLATKLLTKATNDIFNEDNAYALHYFPICEESTLVMKKALNDKFFIHKIDSCNLEEVRMYGALRDYIITKQPNKDNYFENE